MARSARPSVPVARNVKSLRRLVEGWRAAGERVALVPTMGALHAGHVSLITAARRRADRIVVSIFVNPTQFAPSEDFATYPRTFAADRTAVAAAGADLVYAPTVEEMYPEGFATTVMPEGPATAGLEDRFRPTHFAGVATVVAKLFTQARPHVAIFGQKDYQQLQVITRMARDLDLDVQVIGAPTVREPDGLAMSSRNRYLDSDERARAILLSTVLEKARKDLRGGARQGDVLAEGATAISEGGFALDYLELRRADSLAPLSDAELAALPAGGARLLVAARIGRTRLIDNIAV